MRGEGRFGFRQIQLFSQQFYFRHECDPCGVGTMPFHAQHGRFLHTVQDRGLTVREITPYGGDFRIARCQLMPQDSLLLRSAKNGRVTVSKVMPKGGHFFQLTRDLGIARCQ
ncbi:MAG: hypothetical protein P4L90_20685, partial [Rhodopila sp.]|nr:hypothetical protein [Rhodopila sp.]